MGPKLLQLELVYDVCHNIAKIETHDVLEKKRRSVSTARELPGLFLPAIPNSLSDYRELGQPVLIPGDMGRYSYVLVGTEKAYQETFGSTCHGAGRVMSRHEAKRKAQGKSITKELESKGIIVRGASRETLVEEIPEAYKDVSDVVRVVHEAGISKKVVRLKPLGVIKG